MTSWAWWFHFFGDDIVAPETEAGFCPKSEHIIFQHWVPTFGKPIIKFLGFGFAQLLLSLRLDNSLFFSIFQFHVEKQTISNNFYWNTLFEWFFLFLHEKPELSARFRSWLIRRPSQWHFCARPLFTVLQGPRLVRNLFGTCSGFVRVCSFFVFFALLRPNLVGTCSELVRVSFGSGAGSVWDCFFPIQPRWLSKWAFSWRQAQFSSVSAPEISNFAILQLIFAFYCRF